MKTFIRFLPFFLFATLLIAMGCSKDTNSAVDETKAIHPDAHRLHSMLSTFRSSLTSSLKDGQTMTVDSALWYVEASLNEEYARIATQGLQTYTDSAIVTLPVGEGGQVSLSDVSLIYSMLTDSLSDHYAAVPGDKQVSLVYIGVISADSASILIQMTDYIAEDSQPMSGSNWTFGNDDYWYWGLGAGKCNTPGYFGLDAATQLTTYANNSLPYGGSTYYFSNLSNTGWIFPEDVPDPNPNPYGYLPYRLFYNQGLLPASMECLTPNAMNFYLYNLKLIAQLPQFKPAGKSIANYQCAYDLASTGSYYLHLHKAKITYGYPNVAIDPPQEP